MSSRPDIGLQSAQVPIVTIGMPVYNGEKTLASVFDSLLSQSFGDFELIVSDNASTDETQAICVRYAEEDPRVRYVRQERNLGAEANFRYVFEQARSEYFMWAAADDLRSSDFLATNVEFLRTHHDYVGSTSQVRFAGGQFDANKMGDRSLDDDDPHRRVTDFFRTWHANGLFYSLLRTQAVATWPHLSDWFFLGADWTLVTHLASIGKLNRADAGWVELGRDGMSNTTDIFARYRRTSLDWIVPFHRLSSDTLFKLAKAPFAQRLLVLRHLIRLNYQAVRAQFRLRRLHAERTHVQNT